jgi:ribosomal protein S18 acetylase RimI-like enzyme
VHRHLDYRPPLDWVEENPFLVHEENGVIQAALACPQDPPSVSWIRLFAASSHKSPGLAWTTLWGDALEELKSNDVCFIAAIPLQTWFESILGGAGFEKTHSIVMLNRETTQPLETEPIRGITIRPMTFDDIPLVQKIDEESFSPIWVNSAHYLEIAFRQAIVATVAEMDGLLVGYQISTASPIGGHLARLAVRPNLQGNGIGSALVGDLIHQFNRRAARFITVNTQEDNLASLSLYRRAGFSLTGEKYPIYQLLSF